MSNDNIENLVNELITEVDTILNSSNTDTALNINNISSNILSNNDLSNTNEIENSIENIESVQAINNMMNTSEMDTNTILSENTIINNNEIQVNSEVQNNEESSIVLCNNLKKISFFNNDNIFKFPNVDLSIINFSNNLFSWYLKQDFFKINEQMNRFIKNNSLLTEKENEKIIYIFNKMILLKNTLRKYLFNKKSKNENWTILNETDLSLNNFNDKDNYILIKNYYSKMAYKFSVGDILKLYKHSIYNSNGDFVYPSPKQLVNPYTGETITLKQHIDIYNDLLKFYSSKVKCLPNYICNFKGSYFCINKYMSRFNTDLFYRSAYYYVNNLTDSEWDKSFIEYILSFTSIKKTFCKTCFKKFSNRRKILTKVLVIGNLNDNSIFSYGDAINIYLNLAKKYSLIFSNTHIMNHRLRRVRSRFHNRRSRYYSSVGTNTVSPARRQLSNGFLLPSNESENILTFRNPLFRRNSLLIENRSSFNSPIMSSRPSFIPPPPPPPIRITNVPLLNLSNINNINNLNETNSNQSPINDTLINNSLSNNLSTTTINNLSEINTNANNTINDSLNNQTRQIVDLTISQIVRDVIEEVDQELNS